MSIESRLIDLDAPPPIIATGPKPHIGQAAHQAGLHISHVPLATNPLSSRMFRTITNLWAGKPNAQNDHLKAIQKAMGPRVDGGSDVVEADQFMHYLSNEVGLLKGNAMYGNKGMAIDMISAQVLKDIDNALPAAEKARLRNVRTDVVVNLLRSTHTMNLPVTQMKVVELLHQMLRNDIVPQARFSEAYIALGLALPKMEQNLRNMTTNPRHNPLHKGYQLLRNGFHMGPLLHKEDYPELRPRHQQLTSTQRLEIMTALLAQHHLQSTAWRPPSASAVVMKAKITSLTSGVAGLFGGSAAATAIAVSAGVVGTTAVSIGAAVALPATGAAAAIGAGVAYYAGMRGGVRDSLFALMLGQLDSSKRQTNRPYVAVGVPDLTPQPLDDMHLISGWIAMLGSINNMKRGELDRTIELMDKERGRDVLTMPSYIRPSVEGPDAIVADNTRFDALIDMAVALAGQHAHIQGRKNRDSADIFLTLVSDKIVPAVAQAKVDAIRTAITALRQPAQR